MPTLRKIMDVIGVDGTACVIAVVAAAFLSIFITPTVRHFAFWLRVVDEPGPRRVHIQPTARLGGIGVLAGILGGAVLGIGVLGGSWDKVWSVLAIGAGVCFLGALDDLRSLSPVAKLSGLALAGGLLTLTGISIEIVHVPGLGAIQLGWLALPATIAWVVACSNAVNLIDGVDGAATGVVTIAACTMALCALATGDPMTAVLFGATCGAAGGFLVHNRQPASIFLGDSGSLLLGFMLAATSAAGTSKSATAWILLGTLVVLAVPFLEAIQSFIRRFCAARASDKITSILSAIRATAVADTGHIHHRLLARGLSHHRVSFILHVVTAIIGVTTLLLVPSGMVHWSAALAPLLVGVIALFVLAGLKPREAAPETPRMVIPRFEPPNSPEPANPKATPREKTLQN